MVTLSGFPICDGIVFGKIYIYKRKIHTIDHYKVSDTDAEIDRFLEAKDAAVEELGGLYEQALEKTQAQEASIFSIHQMLLNDPYYLDTVNDLIKTQKLNAEAAVSIAEDSISQMFLELDDDYLKQRSVDVKDVSERVLAVLSHAQKKMDAPDEPSIIFADELSPSETLLLSGGNALAFVTEQGSANSHAAILAKTMNIPMVVGTRDLFDDDFENDHAVVDAFSGEIYIAPDADTIQFLIQKADELLCAEQSCCLK